MRLGARFHETTCATVTVVAVMFIFAVAAAQLTCCAWAETPSVADDPASRRAVHARELPATSVDNETSWIIEPDVPRIPKIPGLDAQLPPHIERRLSYAFDLAQRGAIYTSNSEFRAVIGLCALELDSRSDGTSHRDALREGFVALEEADDFGGEQLDWHESADVRRVAADHTTAVLKGASRPVDSIEAVQRYYSFAEDRLATACRGVPGSSLAFYGLARTYVEPGMHATHAAAKAALLHRVALAIAPQNVLARNELGVLLAQHGQFAESEQLFRQCIATTPRTESLQNLSVVYARLGDMPDSKAALAASEALKSARNDDKAPNGSSTNAASEQSTKESGSNDAKHKPSFLARLNLSSLTFWR
ncbi:MAG TPA: tetratricopeptide repeat protein [Lacipirellulaceae bacterium]|nr:tetratricopeptide repeat protein [Lacipirellulaceae bacterium]